MFSISFGSRDVLTLEGTSPS